MIADKELAEYLTEIRDRVCSRCVERPPGGPPCAPQGKDCGIELHLPQLVESIHSVHSRSTTPYLDHNRHEICEKCAFLHSSICPCPMDYLATLVVEAVETVDARRASCAREEQFLTSQIDAGQDEMDEIHDAYAEAVGAWTRCDWPTNFGKAGLNLLGLTTADAEAFAVKSIGTPGEEDWRAAAQWLTRVQRHARQAEVEATSAYHAARAGDWPAAKRHAEHAWILEFTTGRPVRRFEAPTWQRFRQAIVNAFRAHALDEFEMQGQD